MSVVICITQQGSVLTPANPLRTRSDALQVVLQRCAALMMMRVTVCAVYALCVHIGWSTCVCGRENHVIMPSVTGKSQTMGAHQEALCAE